MKSYSLIIFLMLIYISQSISQTITVEAENGILQGTTTATAIAGYSGSGYVNGLDTDGDEFSVIFKNTKLSGYNIIIRYNGKYKEQDIYVNNKYYFKAIFPETNGWQDCAIFRVYFHGGSDTISIVKNWGWTDFDKLSATPNEIPLNDYSHVVTTLIDAQANASTLAKYDFLRANFGVNVIAGQTFYWNELIALAQRTPVIRAFDFQPYTIGYSYLWSNQVGGHTFGWTDNGTVKSAIDWYNSTNKKGIVSFQWHWHSPSGGQVSTNTFYTNSTTFDVSKAIIQGTTEYTAIIRDIDSIASQLKRLQNADVPVLFRPLHEAGGAWFWWGAKGAAPCKALWDILYNRLTNFHHIHNLIWVWSTPETDWYLGNSKVDIIGFDSYPGAYIYSSQKKIFDDLFTIVNGEKIVAMTENGPIPDIDECIGIDAPWSYFSSWNDMVADQNDTAHIQEVFAHANVITLDEVPDVINTINDKEQVVFRVYPNPASQSLVVSMQSLENTNSEIQIMNALGQIIFTSDYRLMTNDSFLIDISHLKTGLYFVRIGNEVQKFVKE